MLLEELEPNGLFHALRSPTRKPHGFRAARDRHQPVNWLPKPVKKRAFPKYAIDAKIKSEQRRRTPVRKSLRRPIVLGSALKSFRKTSPDFVSYK